jgi:hypothetical protein
MRVMLPLNETRIASRAYGDFKKAGAGGLAVVGRLRGECVAMGWHGWVQGGWTRTGV